MNRDLERYYLPWLLPKKGGVVLDFGSGHGRVIEFLRAHGFTSVHGFERNRALAPKLEPSLLAATTFGDDGISFLRESGRRWDAVILKDVLYYFDDRDALAFLRELRSHLAPNAVLIAEVFNGATLTGPYVMYKDRGIRRAFTEHSLQGLLAEAGFETKELRGLVPAVTGLRSLLYWIGSMLWSAALRLVFWAERGADAQNPRILEKKIVAMAVPRP